MRGAAIEIVCMVLCSYFDCIIVWYDDGMDTIDNRQIEYMALGELMTRLHPQNPKSHDLGAIIQSYQTHGFVASGILDDRTGLFLAVHGRIQALDSMKRQHMDVPDGIRNGGDDWLVPVQVGYSSKNDVQAKAYIVADNKLTVLGGWDEPALAELLQEVAGSVDVALESTGFSGDDLDELLSDLNEPPTWKPDVDTADPSGDGIEELIGYGLSSFWKDLSRENEISKYMLTLPPAIDTKSGSTIKAQFSRTNATATERIVKTYMRTGDVFYEMCCGWMTFSSTAKYFGFSGKGGDIWDTSLKFCKRQILAMPGDGNIEVVYADCRDTKESTNYYDFVHSNPPFFSLETYGGGADDLAATNDYDMWINAMGEMAVEACRILTPGGLANFVINDYRDGGILIPMHSDFINSILSKSELMLHDFVVAEVLSQSIRFRKRVQYPARYTVKCHEYIITFKKPTETGC